MSQLRVSGQSQQDFFLNVLSFDSPITGEMNSGQTKSQIQYFPIKAFQPELTCSVIFPNEAQWESWQAWVRQNMINSQKSNSTGNPGVTLNWPQRNINNWTAVIPSAKAGGMRANYTPRTVISFQLIVSLVSNLAVFSSFGSAFQGLFGSTTVSGLDALFTLPEQFLGGSITSGNAGVIFGGGNNNGNYNPSAGIGALTNSASSVVTSATNNVSQLIPGLTSILGGGIPL